MADQSVSGPVQRLRTGLAGESYGSKIIDIAASEPQPTIPAVVTITWDGTQTAQNETDAAAYILTFSWPPNGNEKVAALAYTAESFGAMMVVAAALARSAAAPTWAKDIIQTQADLFVKAHDNDAPTCNVPGDQTATNGVPKVFSSATSNLISITDAAATGSVKMSMSVSLGTFTLAGIVGLTFTTGDGTADASMVFTGSVANVNTALATVTYTASSTGTDSFKITCEDQGNTTYGTNQFDVDTIKITVS